MLRHRLRALLADQFPTEAPFTIQRLAELLLEPHKHYSRLDKLVSKMLARLSLQKMNCRGFGMTTEQAGTRIRKADTGDVDHYS